MDEVQSWDERHATLLSEQLCNGQRKKSAGTGSWSAGDSSNRQCVNMTCTACLSTDYLCLLSALHGGSRQSPRQFTPVPSLIWQRKALQQQQISSLCFWSSAPITSKQVASRSTSRLILATWKMNEPIWSVIFSFHHEGRPCT